MRAGNLFFIVTFMAAFLTSSQIQASAKKVLTVGVLLRFQDKYNGTVDALKAGIEVAKVQFEKTHPNSQINLKYYGHNEDLSSVRKAAEQVLKDKVTAVIGGEMSEESIAIGDTLKGQSVVFITPTSSNPKVTEGKPYVFRVCFSDDVVARKLAEFTMNTLNPAAIGVIHNLSTPYTDYLAREYLTYFLDKSSNGPARIPIYEEKILRDNLDFEKQIDRFIEKKVTHVAMLTREADFTRFSLQAANKNFFPVYIGSDGWGSNERVFETFVSDSPNGSKFEAIRNSYWKQEVHTPFAQDFKRLFRKLQGKEASAWNAIAFDSAWVLFTAMNKVSKPDKGEQIQKEMVKLRNIQLVTTERFSFGYANSPKKDLYLYRINKNGIKYEATLR